MLAHHSDKGGMVLSPPKLRYRTAVCSCEKDVSARQRCTARPDTELISCMNGFIIAGRTENKTVLQRFRLRGMTSGDESVIINEISQEVTSHALPEMPRVCDDGGYRLPDLRDTRFRNG